MRTPVIWMRPELRVPHPFDTIIFDVDGVLIRAIDSFHAADIAVAEYIAGTINRLDWDRSEGKPLVTIEDVRAFKRAGGYNNDWDMCYLLSALFTARLREWKGTSFAERSIEEWSALSRKANLRGHGGIAWVHQVIPATAQPDYNIVGDIYHEAYWGAIEFEKRFGRPPRYLPDAPGFVHREEILFPSDFPAQLRKTGIQHLGIITGRVGPEVDSALEHIEEHSGERWWDVVIPADICPKPDPRAMRLAIEAVGAKGGLYIGDTADDLDLVLRYRAGKKAYDPDILAAMIVSEDEVPTYQERGADFIFSSVVDVLDYLADRIVVKGNS
jgi:phosphoglycolate phosphatase-like HAD superfamily hydrolase